MTVAELRRAWEALPDAVVACGAGGGILCANAAARRMFGKPLEGQPLTRLVPPSERHRWEKVLTRFLGGRRALHRLRFEAVRLGEGLVTVEASVGPLEGGGAVLIAREVRASKARGDVLADLAIRAQLAEERTRLVLESVGEGILGLDPRGSCVFANPASARLLGYRSTEELLGRDVRDLTGAAPESAGRGRRVRHIDELCLEQTAQHVDEDLLTRADGETFWAECWSHPIRRGRARIGAVITFVDVTARKRADEERERLRLQLEDAVRVRDEFLALASHELRTPLTPLQLHVQGIQRALSRGADGLSPGDILTRLDAVTRQIARIERLVSELLDAGRLTGKATLLELEDVDLGAVVREVVARHQDDLARARCELQLDAQAAVVGRWDRKRLDQVVSNLLSNAIKFGRGRRIELRVCVSPRTGAASLLVRDHGIGIAPADHARIFERFERAVPSRHYGGFGLGLWMVSQFVHAMGGEVQLESALGEGATFTVELPTGTSGGAQALAS